MRTVSAPLNLISLRKGAPEREQRNTNFKEFEPSKFGIEKVGVEFYGYGLEVDPDDILSLLSPSIQP